MSWSDGYLLRSFPLAPELKDWALCRDWERLDRHLAQLVGPHGELFRELAQHAEFRTIEHMLALRDGSAPEEEDGIWHDDGSRVLAFSLSLNYFGLPVGGEFEIRAKGQPTSSLGPYAPGTLIIFRTGVDGFEHRTRRVIEGKRLVCAGWCSR